MCANTSSLHAPFVVYCFLVVYMCVVTHIETWRGLSGWLFLCSGCVKSLFLQRSRLETLPNCGSVCLSTEQCVRFTQIPSRSSRLTAPSRCPPPSLPPSLIRSCHPAERRGKDDGSVPTTSSSRRRHSAQHGHRSRTSEGRSGRRPLPESATFLTLPTEESRPGKRQTGRSVEAESNTFPLLAVSYFVGKYIFMALNR